MKIRLLALVLLSFALTGCRTVQTIMAHTVLVPYNRTFIYGDVGILEGRTAADGRGRDEAEQLREQAFTFEAVREKDFSLYRDKDHKDSFTIRMVAVSQNSLENKFPEPVEIVIETYELHGIGYKTSGGYAEIRFGAGGRVYSTSVPGGHFEFLVQDIFENNGDQFASGTFSLIAFDQNNPFPEDRLFVMDGAYICRIKNAQ